MKKKLRETIDLFENKLTDHVPVMFMCGLKTMKEEDSLMPNSPGSVEAYGTNLYFFSDYYKPISKSKADLSNTEHE